MVGQPSPGLFFHTVRIIPASLQHLAPPGLAHADCVCREELLRWWGEDSIVDSLPFSLDMGRSPRETTVSAEILVKES